MSLAESIHYRNCNYNYNYNYNFDYCASRFAIGRWDVWDA